ncbi:hypothetical protein SE904_14850, partial [Enterococcus faecium]|nr:hypothetical protein [Enterococcus faecium]
QSINQCKITKNLSQNVVHSDSDLILHNSSVLIDKEPDNSAKLFKIILSDKKKKILKKYLP